MAAQIKKLIPILETPNLKATVDFYTQKLGFTCIKYSQQYHRATLKRDRATIIFATELEYAHLKKPTMSASFYLYADDVDTLWEEIKDKAEICHPIGDREWGMRQFSVFDNNGYVLIFGQTLNKPED